MLTKFYLYLLDHIGPWVFIDAENISYLKSWFPVFGVHDFVLVSLGNVFYSRLLKAKSNRKKLVMVIIYASLFLYILPDLSATFEAQRVQFFVAARGDIIDGFNLLYIFARFPMYLFIGALIVVVYAIVASVRARLKEKMKN